MMRDDRGLYLRVDPSGRKYWILRYWEQKKEHQLSLGPYPLISLQEARIKRDEIQAARIRGESPRVKKRGNVVPFTDLSDEWLRVKFTTLSENYLACTRLRLKKHILPTLGNYPVTDITSADVLRLARKIEVTGKTNTARRCVSIISQVLRYGIATGILENDVTSALRGALAGHAGRHYATITNPTEIGFLMRAIQGYPYPLLRLALLFSILTFARPGEIRRATWAEIRTSDALWDIPAEKMKMRRRHLIPLSTQALDVLTELRELTGTEAYLFPSARNAGQCISDTAVRLALRSIGYTKEQITPHGFRAMASTILNENGWNRDVIERQLAHVPGGVRAAYNHAEYLEERRRMMQWWADWLYKQARG